MVIIFIIVCLIIAFLVTIMFLILKKTVGIVNDQTKSYFVNKLQGYDDLIQDKENKLLEIETQIKDKEKGIKEEETVVDNNILVCRSSHRILQFLYIQYMMEKIF